MTLPDICEYAENQETMSQGPSEKVGLALKAVLQQASSQGRATCSLTSSVDLLSSRPDDVMLCVMPLVTSPDASANIQSTLIRAVCQEHSIRVLFVDCDVKLAKIVCLSDEEDVNAKSKAKEDEVNANCKPSSGVSSDTLIFSDCDNLAPAMGFPCVLVEYPKDGASLEDEMVAEYVKEQLYSNDQQMPYAELPD